MKVRFWGTRGSIAVPGKDTIHYGGNTTCLEMTLESGRKIIIDAGTGIRPLGEKLLSKNEKIDILLLVTHIHWDHILGFPFFAPIHSPDTRITIDGSPNCMKGLRVTFDTKMGDGFFPVKFDDLLAEMRYEPVIKDSPLQVDAVTIDHVPLQHPQGGFGFRFREGDKTFIFITDNELTVDAWADRHPEDYARFCMDADILIHDCQYTPEERELRKGWGHSDYEAVLDLAQKAHVRKLILFHHDPSRKDPQVDSMLKHCQNLATERNLQLEIDAAREGHELTL